MRISENMNLKPFECCGASIWYEALSAHTFPTTFVKLKPLEIQVLAEGGKDTKISEEIISRLRHPMKSYPGNCFVFTDFVAPTDTERFMNKGGAVFSPESAWKFLCMSDKVREFASSGYVEHICVRPFRRISRPREFRLFIYKGRLSAMSQYWLTRHYKRLEGIKKKLWEKADKFVNEISWLLPHHTLVMDVYFTSTGAILIIDLNIWGEPTNPLLLKTWENDWNTTLGIFTIPPPTMISGDINVSF